MLTHTGDQPSDPNKELWKNMSKCYPHTISNDTKRVILCEVLHTLQSHLQRRLISELEDSHEDSSSKATPGAGSDGVALYRIGGWALLSAIKFRHKCIKQNKGKIDELKEELHVLKALQLPTESKVHMPAGLTSRFQRKYFFPT